ncbi:MAG: NUDIX hydrolase, partial [Alphaproteobacteria bacterium]
REETGLEIDIVDTVAVVDSIIRDDAGAVEYHYTLIDVLAEWRAGEARPGGDAADIVWADPDGLEPYDLWRETVRVIGLARARRA